MSFVLTTDLGQTNTDGLMRRAYELYADYVAKNPAYTLDNPMNNFRLFDEYIDALLTRGIGAVVGV